MLTRCPCTACVNRAHQSVQFAGRKYEVLWICSICVPLRAWRMASEITVLACFVNLQRLLLCLVACSGSQGLKLQILNTPNARTQTYSSCAL